MVDSPIDGPISDCATVSVSTCMSDRGTTDCRIG